MQTKTKAESAAKSENPTANSDFDALVGRIQTTSDALRQDALSVVNRSVTARAWITGFYIVEYEQHGKDRAKYGEGLLKKLAKRLGEAGFALSSLKNDRLFYLTYPDLAGEVAGYIVGRFGKGQSLIGLSGQYSTSAWNEGIPRISPNALFNRLSYTHILQLLSLPDDLQSFILEMGAGFCFEARQKKILIDDACERIDLVFYHRILKCHVLIELKSKKFNYADAAQLGVYMAYYRKNVCEKDDNPPVGILLCTEVGREMAEYISTFVDPELFVSKYSVQLPPKEKIVEFLKRENAAHGENGITVK